MLMVTYKDTLPERRPVDPMRTLFVTCVGSHMWRMNDEASDVDLSVIYIAPTRSILRGEAISPTVSQQIIPKEGTVYDILGWELGHLMKQLLKGNINAIWYSTSPLVPRPSPYQEELKALVTSNLCRSTYHSLAGMAESQIKEGQKLEGIDGKGYRTALRTMNFGIGLLSRGELCYEPVNYTPERDEVLEKKQQLLEAYEASHLPDLRDGEAFREFLFKLRMEEMAGRVHSVDAPLDDALHGQEPEVFPDYVTLISKNYNKNNMNKAKVVYDENLS